MDKKVLVIWGEGSSFFLTNIREKIKEKGIEPLVVEPQSKNVTEEIDNVEYILFYISDEIPEKKEFLLFLRDLCLEKEKHLCLIGNVEHLDEVCKILNSTVVMEKFARPIDVNVIVESIMTHLNDPNLLAKKKHILVIDDSPITLRTVKSWFEDKYKVSIVSSAAQALTFLGKNKPDVILLDYEMPLCSGPQFMEMLHEMDEYIDIPIIFLTSKNDQESVAGALTLKPAGYLLKTMEPQKIKEYVDSFMDKLAKQ